MQCYLYGWGRITPLAASIYIIYCVYFGMNIGLIIFTLYAVYIYMCAMYRCYDYDFVSVHAIG